MLHSSVCVPLALLSVLMFHGLVVNAIQCKSKGSLKCNEDRTCRVTKMLRNNDFGEEGDGLCMETCAYGVGCVSRASKLTGRYFEKMDYRECCCEGTSCEITPLLCHDSTTQGPKACEWDELCVSFQPFTNEASKKAFSGCGKPSDYPVTSISEKNIPEYTITAENTGTLTACATDDCNKLVPKRPVVCHLPVGDPIVCAATDEYCYMVAAGNPPPKFGEFKCATAQFCADEKLVPGKDETIACLDKNGVVKCCCKGDLCNAPGQDPKDIKATPPHADQGEDTKPEKKVQEGEDEEKTPAEIKTGAEGESPEKKPVPPNSASGVSDDDPAQPLPTITAGHDDDSKKTLTTNPTGGVGAQDAGCAVTMISVILMTFMLI